MDPVVTAVRAAGSGQVLVEVDGRPWTTLSVDAAARAGISEGITVDDERAAVVDRERRNADAAAAALRALRARDHTRRSLDERLARRGIAPEARAQAVDRLVDAGLLDDVRFARGRADALAGRGKGDEAIRADLERHGVAAEVAREALAGLEPEAARARTAFLRLGGDPRALRRLAARGFSEDALDDLLQGLPESQGGDT